MVKKKATFAAGCFWGVEAEFRDDPRGRGEQVGYTSGDASMQRTRRVCSGSGVGSPVRLWTPTNCLSARRRVRCCDDGLPGLSPRWLPALLLSTQVGQHRLWHPERVWEATIQGSTNSTSGVAWSQERSRRFGNFQRPRPVDPEDAARPRLRKNEEDLLAVAAAKDEAGGAHVRVLGADRLSLPGLPDVGF